MDYDYFLQRLGHRFNLVNGDLVEVEDGQLLVTTDFKQYSIYLNPIVKSWDIIVPVKSYLARKFKLRYNDCISLNLEWLDDHYNTGFIPRYKNTNTHDFYKIFKQGLALWYPKNGFIEVDVPEQGDTLLYAWKSTYNSHVATYLGDNKILHHVPQKLSSIDEYDPAKIKGIYRYGSNT